MKEYTLRILALAAAYVVTGKLSLLLAIPPGYATAIFPPAGIALAAVHIGGYRLLPGVWLGSFAMNLWVTAGMGAGLSGEAILLAGMIAMGALLQALLGVLLVNRYVGRPAALDDTRSIVLFSGLGGAVSCLCGATVGVTTLYLHGSISPEEYPYSWFTWWIGDAIGVLVAAPLSFILIGAPRQLWRPRAATVAVPLAVALAAVVFMFYKASDRENERIAQSFRHGTEHLIARFKDRIDAHLALLHSIERLHATTGRVDREQFLTFVAALRAEQAGLDAVSWDERVLGEEREAYEQAMRNAGYSGFRITELSPDGQRQEAAVRREYIVVAHIDPESGNAQALGLDVASEPARAEALAQARDTGLPVATAPIKLVQGPEQQAAVLIFSPVYKTDRVSISVADRRSGLAGFATGVLRVDTLIDTLNSGEYQNQGHIRLLDTTNRHAPLTLFDPPAVNAAASGLAWQQTFPVAGREWTLVFTATSDYLAARRTWSAWAVLAGGLTLSGLMGAFFLLVTGQKARVDREVEERTAALSGALDSLREAEMQTVAALNEKETLLKEVYHRVKNNLQVIQSLLSLQGRALGDGVARTAMNETVGRVRAMALVHEKLYQSDSLAAISLHGYVRDLLAQLAESTGAAKRGIRVQADVQDMRVNLDTAIPLGLLLNELVSNSLKHAFPDGRSGEVLVSLRAQGDGAALIVADSGVGMAPDYDIAHAASMGIRLAANLARQLGGRLDIAVHDGTRFSVEIRNVRSAN